MIPVGSLAVPAAWRSPCHGQQCQAPAHAEEHTSVPLGFGEEGFADAVVPWEAVSIPRQHLHPHPPSNPDTRRGEEGQTQPDCFDFTA